MEKHTRNQDEKRQNSKKNIISIDIVEINALGCSPDVVYVMSWLEIPSLK